MIACDFDNAAMMWFESERFAKETWLLSKLVSLAKSKSIRGEIVIARHADGVAIRCREQNRMSCFDCLVGRAPSRTGQRLIY
ncbi:MAG: hypothetical protein KK476_06755 [Sinorhizobium fredii]|nr:hypothetical protein [Sinorhizobium fredii]